MNYSSTSYSIFLTIFIATIIGFGNTGHLINNAFAQYAKQPERYHEQDLPSNYYPVLHKITLGVEEISLIGGNLFAYKMIKHTIHDLKDSTTILKDITERYQQGPTIPGPTIIINEGDVVSLTLENDITTSENAMVSVHVHGIHYPITSDGTLTEVNKIGDQGVHPGEKKTYSWTSGPGTVGTWPYHDHTLGLNTIGKDPNGLELSGLFGTLIINDADGFTDALIDGKHKIVNIDDISKDIACWVSDDAFWCNEVVNNYNNKHIALWENPTIKAVNNELIRFHLLSIGTDFSIFELTGYEWLDPGTNNIINQKEIGPLEKHVFTIDAKKGDSQYRDIIQNNFESGMFGDFIVDSTGFSIPGKVPWVYY